MTKPKTGVDVLREALRVRALSDIACTWGIGVAGLLRDICDGHGQSAASHRGAPHFATTIEEYRLVLPRRHGVSSKIQLLTPLLLQLRARGRYGQSGG